MGLKWMSIFGGRFMTREDVPKMREEANKYYAGINDPKKSEWK